MNELTAGAANIFVAGGILILDGMLKKRCLFIAAVTTLSYITALISSGAQASTKLAPRKVVGFKKIVLDKEFRSEGVAVADVNRDGRPDVLAGNLWYEAPLWKSHTIAPVEKFEPATGYSNSFFNFAWGVNGDNWPDQVVIGEPGSKVIWRENPKKGKGYWKEHSIGYVAYNESPSFANLLQSSGKVLVFPSGDSQMAWYEPTTEPTGKFISHIISELKAPGTERYSHGLGIGDVNGDGRPDVIVNQGYWEAPVNPRTGPWRFIAANLGPNCAQMYSYDVNGDGLMDVLSSSAHNLGVWWYEQQKQRGGQEEGVAFKQHTISDAFSQSHALVLADLNRDGLMDVVTGKRFWAHGPKGDVSPNDPAVLYWFELQRQGGKVNWIPHEIDNDSGVGTQFVVADLNGDGKLDIVISNKKGVFVFEQT